MDIITHLTTVIDTSDSYVQSYLAKEDLVRVTKLFELATQHDELKAMQKAGLYIGWTQNDMRTHELKAPLSALIQAVFTREKLGVTPEIDAEIMSIWAQLHTLRLKTLVHCK